MRRWHILNRLRRNFSRQEPDRCILVVEELEAREVLSPVVIAPGDGFVASTPEGVTYTLSGNTSFSVFEDGEGGPDYQANFTAINGTVSFATLPAGTTTFTGTLSELNSLLASGITFQPTDYFSGIAEITLTVTDAANSDATGADTLDVTVTPQASVPAFGVQSSGEVWAPSSGFVFPPGFVSVAPWPDLDGSETVTVTFSLDAANPDAFTLSASGVPLTPLEPGLWQISSTDPAALQATLDTLVLTPPVGFNGFADLSIYASNTDQPPDQSSPPDTADLGYGYVPLRFFVGGSVTTPAVFGIEGGNVDLGGRFVASDSDEMFGDIHTLTLSVSSGTLTLDPVLVPEGVSAESDGTTVTVTGTIDDINAFLGTSGIVTYTPASPYFSGVVPLSVMLTNQPGDRFSDRPSSYNPSANSLASLTIAGAAPNAFSGVVALSFVPVADHVFPSAVDVTTNQDTPVALSISTTALADTDGSESLLIVLEGIPAGATLNHGTDLGGGQWALSSSDLAGLTFTPPPGATGTYTLTVKAIVTDTAPDLGASDSATESTTFTVTVLPVPVTTSPPPPPTSPPPVVPPVVPTVPPVVQNLPPAPSTVVLFSAAPITNTTTTVITTTTTTSTENAQTTQVRAVTFDAYASAPNTDQISATQTQVGYSPPAQGSLFAQAEAPLPTYAYGEKHPLPPVLPLDQTLPVAGFTDSGGDSFALIDKLYRDANDRTSANQAPPAALATQAAITTVTLVWTAPASTLTVTPEREASNGNQEAAPLAPEPPEGNWPTWLAASAAVLAAWAWLARGSEGRLTQGVWRFFRTLHRRLSQRTA